VNCFAKIFEHSLHKSILEAVTWNTGVHTMFMPAKMPKPIKDPSQTQPRHRKDTLRDPGFRKHQQTVPTMHKTKINITPAETAVKRFTSKKVLSQDEIQQICSKYGITRLNTSNPRCLGNTGMTIKFDPSINGYVLLK